MDIRKWNDSRVTAKAHAAMQRALQDSALLLQASIKLAFPDSGIPNATRKQREANRSKPGEIPHAQLGHLRRSIATQLLPGEARVGTNLPYGRYLELGTVKMAPRPYLRVGLRREAQRILKCFEKQGL